MTFMTMTITMQCIDMTTCTWQFRELKLNNILLFIIIIQYLPLDKDGTSIDVDVELIIGRMMYWDYLPIKNGAYVNRYCSLIFCPLLLYLYWLG